MTYQYDKFKNPFNLFINMSLEKLRSKAFFQNTVDVWIIYCEERGWNWYDPDAYRRFISYLRSENISLQKFPLCIKESGGLYERGRDKTKFLEELSHLSTDDTAAYTIKLSEPHLSKIRTFEASSNV
jgi:hypothetical protein